MIRCWEGDVAASHRRQQQPSSPSHPPFDLYFIKTFLREIPTEKGRGGKEWREREREREKEGTHGTRSIGDGCVVGNSSRRMTSGGHLVRLFQRPLLPFPVSASLPRSSLTRSLRNVIASATADKYLAITSLWLKGCSCSRTSASVCLPLQLGN